VVGRRRGAIRTGGEMTIDTTKITPEKLAEMNDSHLRGQLADSQKKIVMLRDALEYTNINGFCSADACDKMEKALADTEPKP
jgi:hypothetical protein